MATLSVAARNAAIDAITALLDAGGDCNLRLRTSVPVSLLNVSLSGGATPTFAAASGGSATMNGLPKTYAFTASGTIDRYVLDDGTGNFVIFNNAGVGDVGSGAEMEMNVRTVAAGQILRINTLTLSLP